MAINVDVDAWILEPNCLPCPPRPEKLPEPDEFAGDCRDPKRYEHYLHIDGKHIYCHDGPQVWQGGIRWIVRRKQETPPLDEHSADAALWTGLQAEVASEGGADLHLEHSHRRDAAKAPPPRTFEEWYSSHAVMVEAMSLSPHDAAEYGFSAGQESMRPTFSYRFFKEKAESLQAQVDALRTQLTKMAEDCAGEVERAHGECDVALAAMRKAIREFKAWHDDADSLERHQLKDYLYALKKHIAALAKAAEEGSQTCQT
ncbi:MAG: hypothetical protein IMZ71_00225 [Chloroflexi bacterium]|nr:hypothetical protein [Chloroflexota bacterium]